MVTALLSLTISEVTSYYGYFSDELASALAAFAVGAVGNIHARISGHPAIVSIIAGMFLHLAAHTAPHTPHRTHGPHTPHTQLICFLSTPMQVSCCWCRAVSA
jgi:hypothetical protein